MKSDRAVLRVLSLAALMGILSVAAEAVEYTGKGLRDPFGEFQTASSEGPVIKKQPISAEEGLRAMTLQGVVLTQHKTQALIDGQMLEVGSDTAFGKIAAITKEGVTITHNGKEYLLERKKGEGMDHEAGKTA